MVSVSRDRERERKHPSAHRYHVYAIGFPQSIDHVGAPPRTHARTHTHTHARAHTGIQRQAVALCPCWRRWRRQRQWWWWWCCGCRDAQGEEPGRLVVFNGCPFAFLWYNVGGFSNRTTVFIPETSGIYFGSTVLQKSTLAIPALAACILHPNSCLATLSCECASHRQLSRAPARSSQHLESSS